MLLFFMANQILAQALLPKLINTLKKVAILFLFLAPTKNLATITTNYSIQLTHLVLTNLTHRLPK